MLRRIAVAVALALIGASNASAQAGDLEKKLRATDPRPGQRWVDGRPEIGVKEVRVHEGGKEIQAWVVPPGGEMSIKIGGENRILVQARPQMESRTSPELSYAVVWTLDGGPEQRKKLKTVAHRTALFEGGIDGVPGVMDDFVIDVPTQGSHTVVLRVPADAASGVVLRFRYEEPKPSGKSYGSTTGPDSHRETWWMGTVSWLTFGYDDNVWRFSDDDSHAYEEHKRNDPQDKFDHMDSVADFYVDSELDVHIITPENPLGRFYLGGTIENRWYIQNHHLSSDTFGAYLKHSILPNLNYKVWGRWGPDRFYRNLNPQEIPGFQRAHAHYDRYEIGGRLWFRWFKGFSTALGYEWALNDWNGSFNARDVKSNSLKLELQATPAKWITVGLDLEGEVGRALATGDERDGSYRQFSPELDVDLTLGRVLVGGSYHLDWRFYTTDHSRAQDPNYADREQMTHEFGVYIGYRLGESSKLTLKYTRTARTVDLPGRSGSYAEGLREYKANSLEVTLLFLWP